MPRRGARVCWLHGVGAVRARVLRACVCLPCRVRLACARAGRAVRQKSSSAGLSIKQRVMNKAYAKIQKSIVSKLETM
eukprot:3127592-Prymnesium_polylepis.1